MALNLCVEEEVHFKILYKLLSSGLLHAAFLGYLEGNLMGKVEVVF